MLASARQPVFVVRKEPSNRAIFAVPDSLVATRPAKADNAAIQAGLQVTLSLYVTQSGSAMPSGAHHHRLNFSPTVRSAKNSVPIPPSARVEAVALLMVGLS